MVVAHAMIEIERWLQGEEERAAIIGKYATNVTDHVAISADIHDMGGLQSCAG